MNIKIPSEIILNSVTEYFLSLAAACSHMVLESVSADMFHKFLKFRNLCNCDTSVHSVRVVSYEAFSEICLDATFGIVSRNTEICEVTA